MVRASIRMARQAAPRRPLGLSVLAVAGVVFGVVSGLAALAYGALHSLQGELLGQSLIASLVGLLLALLIVWFYWGLWEMVRSAWWMHILVGPLAVIGLLLLLRSSPLLVALLAGRLPDSLRLAVERGASGSILLLAGIEAAAVGYLPSVRRVFGVGAPKPVWER